MQIITNPRMEIDDERLHRSARYIKTTSKNINCMRPKKSTCWFYSEKRSHEKMIKSWNR